MYDEVGTSWSPTSHSGLAWSGIVYLSISHLVLGPVCRRDWHRRREEIMPLSNPAVQQVPATGNPASGSPSAGLLTGDGSATCPSKRYGSSSRPTMPVLFRRALFVRSFTRQSSVGSIAIGNPASAESPDAQRPSNDVTSPFPRGGGFYVAGTFQDVLAHGPPRTVYAHMRLGGSPVHAQTMNQPAQVCHTLGLTMNKTVHMP